MINLFIADDHAVVREALRTLLEARGDLSITGSAENGEALLNLLANTANPDLILLDLEMPHVDGIQVLEKLQQSDKKIPVVVISADESPNSIKRSIRAGAAGFVPKHANADELYFAINSVMKGDTYVSPSVTKQLLIPDEALLSPGAKALKSLTTRELEILKLLADGKKNKDIAGQLFISIRTVDTHRTNILKKLNLKTNSEMTKLAISAGLLEANS